MAWFVTMYWETGENEMKTREDMRCELSRIEKFIREYVHEGEKVVIPVSGGLDSDVVARLCHRVLGRDRIHLFTVDQPGMAKKFLENVKNLGMDLGVSPAVIHPGEMNVQLIRILKEGDPDVGFYPDSLLDPARANCSLRTSLISTYQDKGFLVAANSNLSEIQLGFYMPFGDNLGHFKPIAHLYKSEVRILADILGTRQEIIEQEPSAGFWEGEEDLEDLAFWLYNGGPIPAGKVFSDQEYEKVMKLKAGLSQFKVDTCLELLSEGCPEQEIAEITGLERETVRAVRSTVERSAKMKNRVLLSRMERR